MIPHSKLQNAQNEPHKEMEMNSGDQWRSNVDICDINQGLNEHRFTWNSCNTYEVFEDTKGVIRIRI